MRGGGAIRSAGASVNGLVCGPIGTRFVSVRIRASAVFERGGGDTGHAALGLDSGSGVCEATCAGTSVAELDLATRRGGGELAPSPVVTGGIWD